AMSTSDAKVLRAAIEAGQKRADVPAATTPPPQPLTESTGGTTTASYAPPVENATIGPDGAAIAPASAPDVVKAIIAAGNVIRSLPYKYGGGHGKWDDTGYDCSGSMSYVFHAAGMLETSMDSTGFANWGEPGPGNWITTYGNAGHSFMVVAGLRFDTSGRVDDGSRWHTTMRS